MTKKPKGADIDGLVKLILKGNDDINVVVGPMFPSAAGMPWA
jgi:hypothetical protein